MKISAPEQIISAIKNGHIVVTASRRQQRFVHELWDQHKTETESHLKVWDDANSIAWDEWIMQLYEALTLLDCFATNQQKSPRILTPSAQKWLFKNIIVQQFTEYSTWSSVQQESLINNIYQAWISYNGWLLDTEDDEIKNYFFETEETRLFRNVVLKHQLICSEKNWLPRENVVNYLLKKLNFFNKIIKCNISFYGFSVFTPQQSHFISKLEKNIFDFNMNEIEFSETSENYDRENLIPCVSTESEWKEAARWARDTAEKNPQSAIAVVIPELASQRNKIFRIFQREFQPQLQLQAEKSLPLGFNFSAGEPFSQLAVINSLKSWLGVLTNGHIDHWQAVLEDSFCRGAEVEKWARYQLSKNLTKLNVEYMTLNKFKQFLLTCNIIPLGQWLDIIQLLVEKIENNQTKKYPTQWHQWLLNLLTDIGWPGKNTLDSITFQIVSQWQHALCSLNNMDEICGEINLSKYTQLVDEIIKQTNFQPQTTRSRVQILGSFEAIGIAFDFIRVTGCQADTFPAVAKPNPFLPMTLQKKLDMPSASSQRELSFTLNLLNGYRHLCQQLDYSYAVSDGQSILLPSPLLNKINKISLVEDGPPMLWLDLQKAGAGFLQHWQDEQGLPLAAFNVRSGVNILKDQAACPFRAYARHRLHADTIEIDDIGITPLERGNWVHKTLEMVWRRLGNQKSLLTKTTPQLEELVQQCVDEIILKKSSKLPQTISEILKYEVKRTNLLVLSWIEIDRERAEFVQVEVEKEASMEVGKLKFKVRADRIDTLSSYQKIIIDYKTGKPHTNSWDDDRLDEPQLPLYALTLKAQIGAIAFAQINMESCKLIGYGDENIVEKGIRQLSDWPQQIAQWKINLELLADEYVLGRAAVEPKQNACDYCDLINFCRLKTLQNSETTYLNTTVENSSNGKNVA